MKLCQQEIPSLHGNNFLSCEVVPATNSASKRRVIKLSSISVTHLYRTVRHKHLIELSNVCKRNEIDQSQLRLEKKKETVQSLHGFYDEKLITLLME